MGKHFRPILNPQADYTRGLTLVYPSAVGAHSWQPMSYDPKTGLVYIPVFDAPEVIAARTNSAGAKAGDYAFTGYYSVPNRDFDAKAEESRLGGEFGQMPSFDPVDPKTGHSITRSVLKAWNPVTQKQVWEQTVSEDFESMEGGVTSTAGNLVFQGTSMGELRIYAADSGKLLRTIDSGTAMMGAPSTYLVDGVQYIAVMAGFGADAVGSPLPPKSAPARYDNEGRILVFRLGGTPNIPHTGERLTRPLPVPPPKEGSAADVAAGEALFDRRCASCHGGGLLPDLTRMEGGVERLDTFKQIVLQGLLATGGMERFDDVLSPHDVEQIHAYLVGEARTRYDKQTLNR
jgi:quinohemoprotein ethanol dehydrogenase